MSKTAFILICIALVLFMLFVPNYIAPDTPGEAGKWEFSNIELRAFMFATIILPVFFIIIYSDNLDFNVAPPYIPFIERKNLWGTLAFLALCVSSGLFQIMGDGSLQKFPLENNLLLFFHRGGDIACTALGPFGWCLGNLLESQLYRSLHKIFPHCHHFAICCGCGIGICPSVVGHIPSIDSTNQRNVCKYQICC